MNAVHDRDRLALPEQLAGIDLNLVVAFDALAREASVTRAARRVGVTQSAMSHALGRLRALLGDPLLVRTGNGMVLTPRAEALVVPLRAGLVTLGRALLGASTFEPAETRRAFCLAAPDLFEARRIALSVPHFTSALAVIARSDLVLTAPAALRGLVTPALGVAVLAPPLSLPAHGIGLVWHERFQADPGHRWLRGLVTQVAQSVMR